MTPPLMSGAMDRRITFQSFTVTKNDVTNEDVKTWADVAKNATVWAQVQPLTAKEMTDASRPLSLTDKAFTVRYRSDITELDRIVFDGEQYDIHSVTEVGRREGLRIVARAVR